MTTTAPVKAFSFYEILPNGKILFFVDASLLKSFSHCERYFYLHHVKNLRAKAQMRVKPFPMAIGSWWSDVMELFYTAWHLENDLSMSDIQEIALKAWADNALDDCAAADPEKFAGFGDLAGAVLMLQDYYHSQYTIDRRLWKVVAVESGFGLNKEVFLGETPRVVVYWIGKPDLVVVEGGRLIPVDHKTVSRIDGGTISRYKPSVQMAGYVHSCEIIAKSLGLDVRCDRSVVNICSRARPTDKPRGGGQRKPRFIRAYPTFNREEIDEWKRGVINKCERIAFCLKTGEWNWSETGCDNFYMRPCDYKKPDSSTPSARDIIFSVDFTAGSPWVPYQLAKQREEED